MPAPALAPSPEDVVRVQGLFVEHSEVIRGFIGALMPQFAQADDVLQETFLTVIRKAADFQPGTDFPRWACAIARFKVMEARRKEKRTEDHLADDVIDLLASAPTATRLDSRYDFLDQCLEELAPHTRRAVEMRYEDDQSPALIATALGWTAESTYSVLSRARTFLRDCIHRRTNLMEASQP